jgi:hypothetical protein
MAVERSYPSTLVAELEPTTSRWLWLVKWVLVIPHVVVLLFLWIATAILTIVAGFAILFTGRYPRKIFDFNVGVFRWTWRVEYYAIGAFGTDRYPPFSLQPDPSYPANFEVEYPETLSRELVLVKWWLLALPHYCIVAFFSGGLGVGWASGGWKFATGGGLIAVLAIVAAAIHMFGRQYPLPLFDFIMGMQRWCYRVLTYSALMRDEYPPFRLDNGGQEPVGTLSPAQPLAPEPVPAGTR